MAVHLLVVVYVYIPCGKGPRDDLSPSLFTSINTHIINKTRFSTERPRSPHEDWGENLTSLWDYEARDVAP